MSVEHAVTKAGTQGIVLLNCRTCIYQARKSSPAFPGLIRHAALITSAVFWAINNPTASRIGWVVPDTMPATLPFLFTSTTPAGFSILRFAVTVALYH